MDTSPSPNFAFLAHHDARLVALATQAEQHFAADPTITLFKLRQFGELLAQRAAAKVGLFTGPEEPQQQLIDRLSERGVIRAGQRALFHDLRRDGNAAVHQGKGDYRIALHQLRMARELAIWFQRSFGNNSKFDAGPFVPPAEPKKAEAGLHEELERLRLDVEARSKELAAAQRAVEEAKKLTDAEETRRLSAQQLAAKAKEDAAIWEALANEQLETHQKTVQAETAKSHALEEQNKKLLADLAAVQAAAIALPPMQLDLAIARAANASDAIHLNEADTRKLIDGQLRDAGWEVDSETITFARGVRPTKGKNLAIAEWPTLLDGKDGRADYVLFVGLQAVGVVEAKRFDKDISSDLRQSKRYSAGYLLKGDEFLPEGNPWGTFKVPFLFSTNGRAYLRQLITKSGIWFLDARRKDNAARALPTWYTPDGLVDLLKQHVDEAHAKLKQEQMPYIDRAYQRNAILAVEAAIEKGQRDVLVAMATGTGKTRTCIGLCYRLLKTRRFRRVLFLVDRNALGTQTADALKELRLENLQTFTDIFDVKELGDIVPERGTRLQIATVQAMVRRVLGPQADDDDREIPPTDQYDCIVVDECHRGYILDRELSDREFGFRDEDDYISKYRRVLDHFDAVKIGLTATPAIHTKEVFGAPVFSYSYREAVIDGFLVDHEPPIRIETKLAQDGIHYTAKQQVLVLDRSTQTLNKEELPDELAFEVDTFNKRIITESFNRVVLKELLEHLDPEGDEEKTLIFCATDEHADLVVVLLKELLTEKYGSVDDDTVLKITGTTDRPIDAIRRYRNERQPNIAVTVDLLTTGIDIPRIANLVFLRRVRSRILYEQMIGRATRLCPDIGKERFRIFDAVDLYSAIKDMTDMKPVVVNPLVTFEQLVKEIVTGTEDESRRASIDELIAKLQRKKRSLKGEVEQQFSTAAGMNVAELSRYLKEASVGAVAAFFTSKPALAGVIDRATGGAGYKQIVSEHVDELREVTRGYGKHQSRPPGDYLETFKRFIETNINKIPALLVVTQRPRDLTREDLRALKLVLDDAGYTEKYIQTAWHETKNEDIAATIIGYIRQLALGSPLLPYEERVDAALKRLRKTHKFSDVQAKWLERIADQVKVETVVDRASLDHEEFKAHGGYARLNKLFDGKLESVLGELADEVWKDAG